MNKYRAVVAVAATFLAAITLPALNWAQEAEVTIEEKISSEVDGQLREQEMVIRRAEEQVRMQEKQAARQAAEAEKILIKAANADRKFKIFFNKGEGSTSPGNKIRDASAKIRDAKDDEAREQATKELASALDEYFEEDMKARGKGLEDIRARLAKLERQLDRRRERKEEIIDLQMKVALNEADGLGFYSEPQNKMFHFAPPTPPVPVYAMPADVMIQAPVPVEHQIRTFNEPAPPAPPAPVVAPVPAADPEPDNNPR